MHVKLVGAFSTERKNVEYFTLSIITLGSAQLTSLEKRSKSTIQSGGKLSAVTVCM
jgi:hypothetical protein